MDRARFDEQYKNFHDDRFEDIFETPVLDDDSKTHTNKDFDWSYLMHVNYAARRIHRQAPKWHVDLGSYVYFAAAIGPTLPDGCTFVDLRPLDLPLIGVTSMKADFRSLPFPDGSVDSISSLHCLEHVGLGRYGDTIDPFGDVRAAREIKRVLSKKGRALIVVPMNKKPRICFNAHRIYSNAMFRDLFSGMIFTDEAVIADKRIIRDKEPDGDYTFCAELVK